MRPNRSLALVAAFLPLLIAQGSAAEKGGAAKRTAAPLADPARVAAIAALLPERPSAPGRTIEDRAAWETFASARVRGKLVRAAEAHLGQPLPETTDDLFLDFSKTGNRTRWQKVAANRRGRLPDLVLAECIENRGRFLPAFHELARALCAERTWVMPAHDRSLSNFEGRSVSIDLASSSVAWQLATALHLLGDRVEPDARAQVRARIMAWVLAPGRDGLAGRAREQSWMRGTSNWNAVCAAGVTGAALALLDAREDRALFVAGAEAGARYFLSGFTPDGYCSEGLGYWNYGFGHFLLLAETLSQATKGKVDLLTLPGAEAAARFPVNIHIREGVYPAFADCGVSSRPSAPYMFYINRCFQMGWEQWRDLPDAGVTGSLPENLLLGFPNSASGKPVPAARPGDGLRSWFADAGVLIARPAPGSECRFAAALKGGHNAEHHNHNDLGSYVTVLGREPLLLDPGSEVYTARTFSKDRYLSKVLSSHGHPVPVIGGRLQRTGRAARAAILEAKFTEETDTLSLDLTTAYDTPGLRRATRTFVYSRAGAGRLVVRDEVELDAPAAFETALVTLDDWRAVTPSRIEIRGAQGALTADIDSGGEPFRVSAETIDEDVHTPRPPRRIALRLDRPVTRACVSVTLAPAAGAEIPRRKKGAQ